MGIEYVDKHTFGHLGGGILSYSLLQNSKLPILVNFVIANGIHYLNERNEKSVAPNGEFSRRLKIISVILLRFL